MLDYLKRRTMKDRTFKEKLDRIYDEIWGIGDTTSMSVKDDDSRMKLLDLIDEILGR